MAINKLYYLFFVFILLQACNIEPVDKAGDNIAEEPNDNILIKKIVYNQGTNNEYTEVYNYADGNKLMSIDAGNGNRNIYTYENELLIREDSYLLGKLEAYVELEYNSDGILVQFIEYWSTPLSTTSTEFAYRKVFSYNSDNTITKDIYDGDHNSQTNLNSTEIISFNGKNISSSKDTDDVVEYLYSYDDKNGMFKNIYAIEILNILSENEFGPYIYGNTNNITRNIEKVSNNEREELYEYTYNEKEYPKNALWKFRYNGVTDEDETETIHFFYE